MATSLHNAKKAKNDEFFTRYQDISDEVSHYRQHFRDKIVYCNCDDPIYSNFWRYFHNNFTSLGLKKLIATHYRVDSEPSYALIYEGGDDFNMEAGDVVPIYGDDDYTAGDFRSKDSIRYLKESDIIVTNPPFSLLREFVAQLVCYNKKFIIMGNKNAITYKEIFPLLKNNKIWIGNTSLNGGRWMIIPDYIKATSEGIKIDDNGDKILNIAGVCWFTNLDNNKRHDGLWHIGDKFDKTKAHKYYEGFEERYPKYDNYNAIEVGYVKDIPIDYNGIMGVPITFMNSFNPNEFDILGMSASAGYNPELVGIDFLGEKDARPLINGKNTYARIFIKNRNPIKRNEDTGY